MNIGNHLSQNKTPLLDYNIIDVQLEPYRNEILKNNYKYIEDVQSNTVSWENTLKSFNVHYIKD